MKHISGGYVAINPNFIISNLKDKQAIDQESFGLISILKKIKLQSISNLTNSGLLTIGKHYTLTGSSVFPHFEASVEQDIGTAYTEMHHKSKKALVNQGLSANI